MTFDEIVRRLRELADTDQPWTLRARLRELAAEIEETAAAGPDPVDEPHVPWWRRLLWWLGWFA